MSITYDLFFFTLIEATPPSMQLQQIPFFYPINTQGMIQSAAVTASGVGPAQNIIIPSTNSSGGPATQAPHSMYYPGVYPGMFESVFCFYSFIRSINFIL